MSIVIRIDVQKRRRTGRREYQMVLVRARRRPAEDTSAWLVFFRRFDIGDPPRRPEFFHIFMTLASIRSSLTSMIPNELYGAKITGGGAGGTVAILGTQSAESERAFQRVAARFREKTGRTPYIFEGSSVGADGFGIQVLNDSD